MGDNEIFVRRSIIFSYCSTVEIRSWFFPEKVIWIWSFETDCMSCCMCVLQIMIWSTRSNNYAMSYDSQAQNLRWSRYSSLVLKSILIIWRAFCCFFESMRDGKPELWALFNRESQHCQSSNSAVMYVMIPWFMHRFNDSMLNMEWFTIFSVQNLQELRDSIGHDLFDASSETEGGRIELIIGFLVKNVLVDPILKARLKQKR